MAYNTNNPVGSTDPRDLFDNAGNMDKFENGPNPFYPDRFGVQKLSRSGMIENYNNMIDGQESAFNAAQSARDAEFAAFLESSGFVSLGNYTGGLVFTRYNEYLAYGGFFYRPAPNSIPFTTTGTWVGADEGLFVLFSQDDVLRQDLANPDMGAAMVAFGSDTVSSALQSRVVQVSTIADLRSLEPAFAGQQCELLGHTVAGIGGGAFYAEFGSVAADDNGITVVTTGGKRWVRRIEGFVTPQMFGVIGDGVADDTDVFQALINAVRCTVAGHYEGGPLAGMPLIIPVGEYLCRSLVIDSPIHIKGQANGQATDTSERAKIIFTGTGTLFDFTIKAGYCLIEGLSLKGTKVGGVDIDSAVYGNVAVRVGQGVGGTFRDVYFEGFDIGLLATTRPGDTWGGAYRYFEHCKFRNNTFSAVMYGLVTDSQFAFCDFRSNLTDRNGYIIIKTGSGAGDYQTAGFVQCMFETLGDTVFNKRGLQITGRSYVKAIACYFEDVGVFVGAGSHFVSNSYHRIQNGLSSRVGGGGNVDLRGISAHVKKMNLPSLSAPFWTANNLQVETPTLLDGLYCNVYTVQEGEYNQLTANNFTSLYELSADVVPASSEIMLALVELEYYAPAGVTVNVSVTAGTATATSAPTVATWTESNYYDGVPGWKRKVYTLPLPASISGSPVNYLRPRVDVLGASPGAAIGIRSVSLSVVAG
jgi:hypothetical protein